jgi:hypothetical protein
MSLLAELQPKTDKYGDLIWRGYLMRTERRGKRLIAVYGYDVIGRDNRPIAASVQPNDVGSWDAIINGAVIATCRTKTDAQYAVMFAFDTRSVTA